ncbi:hypothetical protein ASPFODRAFT_54060, partial [Aspergillus luchuensis CBS 106.47]
MTGPWTLPVLSCVGRRSRNDEAAQRHLGKTKIFGNPEPDGSGTGKSFDPTRLLYRSGSRGERYHNDQIGLRC